jgi:hypothetical protein
MIIFPMRIAMKTFVGGLALALVSAAALVAPAHADDTGFASIHSLGRVGGRMCFLDHSHGGSSSGQRSRQAAQAVAVQSWYAYTAGEYGSDWAHIGKAVKRRMNCQQSSSGWSCDLDATPCK